MKLDPWQEEVLKTEGDICLRSGRQCGKSTIISEKASLYAVQNPHKTILVIASVERQAYLLFEKILANLYDNYRSYIKKGKDRPTKTKINLNNGSVIYCLPTGMSGYGIRGYTVDLLIADEAHFIPEEVWTAVTPMLAASHGTKWLLSTPHGREGYYYSCFSDPNFTSFHVSSEECPRIPKEFLAREKARMTKIQYTQEYLGEFIDELKQFFSDQLIRDCMILQKGSSPYLPLGDTFCGVDVARMGEDQTVLFSVERINREILRQINMDITEKTLLTETVNLIKTSDNIYNYKKIYIDTGGMGVGVFDPLLSDEQTRRKVVSIDNAQRSIDKGDRKKKLLKEDLYNNLLFLMEKGKIQLFEDPDTMLSLKSIQYEYTDDKSLKIYGNYSHITEALIRAAWCMQDKGLNIYIY